MTKDELMDLAVAFRVAKRDDCWDVHKALSDAIGAALAKARSDALEEAAKVAEQMHYWKTPDAIRALKENTNG